MTRWFLFALLNGALFYFLFAWARQNINAHILLFDIKKSSLLTIIGCLLIETFMLILYGQRLALLLPEKLKKTFPLVCLGHGLNSFIPFRLGDALRIYYAKRLYEIPVVKILVVTIVEKYLDLFCILSFGAILFLLKGVGVDIKILYLFVFLVICSFIVIFIYKYFFLKDNRLKTYIKKFKKTEKIITAFEDFSDNKNYPKIIFYTFGIWLSTLVIFYIYFKINIHGYYFGMTDALALLVITTISFAFPTVPAGLGIFESGVIFYLIKFVGLEVNQSLALALTVHLIICLPQIIITLFILFFNSKLILKFKA